MTYKSDFLRELDALDPCKPRGLSRRGGLVQLEQRWHADHALIDLDAELLLRAREQREQDLGR